MRDKEATGVRIKGEWEEMQKCHECGVSYKDDHDSQCRVKRIYTNYTVNAVTNLLYHVKKGCLQDPDVQESLVLLTWDSNGNLCLETARGSSKLQGFHNIAVTAFPGATFSGRHVCPHGLGHAQGAAQLLDGEEVLAGEHP